MHSEVSQPDVTNRGLRRVYWANRCNRECYVVSISCLLEGARVIL